MLQFASKKFASSVFGLAIASSLFSAAPVHADQRNFSMVNDSSDVISELYVSRIGTSDWEEDILGVDVLAPGASTNVTFSKGVEGRCRYDVKVVVPGQGDAFLSNVDLCTTLEVVYTKDGLIGR